MRFTPLCAVCGSTRVEELWVYRLSGEVVDREYLCGKDSAYQDLPGPNGWPSPRK